MLQADEFMISLECDFVELAKPEVRASIKEFAIQLQTAGISPMHHAQVRSGKIMASLQTLGPYIVSLAAVLVTVLAPILTAWIKAPNRKVKIKIGDTLIEATSVEEIERLLKCIEEHKNIESTKRIKK